MTFGSGIHLHEWLRERAWHPSALSSEMPRVSNLPVMYIIKENFLGGLLSLGVLECIQSTHSCSTMHLQSPTEIQSRFLLQSPEQKEHLYSPFNSVMPDNIQFIYGKLIKTHRAGPLVYALICLNQQTTYSPLMYSSRWAVSPHFTCDLLDPAFNACK